MYLEGKITQLLGSLNTKELRRLGEFVCSPYFNKNKKIILLFEILRKKHPHFKRIEKEKLFFQVFSDKKKYHDGLLRALVSDLNLLVEKYLTHGVYEQQAEYRDLWLLESLSEKRLYPAFEKKLRQVLESQESTTEKDSDFYYLSYLIERLSYRYTTLTSNRATKSSLQDVIDNLDRYYLASKMKYASIALNRKEIVDVTYDQPLLEETVNFLNSGAYSGTPAIHLYHQLVMTLKYFDEESHYFALKKALFEAENALPIYEIRQLFTALLNYCRRKTILGHNRFQGESFLIYRHLLERNVLIVGGYISHHHFRNIVRVALEVGAFEWAEEFILGYKMKVIPKVRENVYAFNMASFHFAKKEYETAMDFLRDIQYSEIEFIDFYYHMYYKTLLIQTAFELEEIELVFSSLESFRMYLHRNKAISSNFRLAYSNFSKMVKKVINKRLGKRKAGVSLKEEIRLMKPLVHRDWLIDLVGR